MLFRSLDGYKLSLDGGKITMTASEAGEKTTPTISYKATKATRQTTVTNTTTGVDGAAAKNTTAFTVGTTKSATIGGGTLTQGTAHADFEIDGKYTVSFNETSGVVSITAKETGTAGNVSIDFVNDGVAGKATLTGGVDAVKDVQTIDVTGWNDSNLGDLELTFAAGNQTLNYDRCR